MRKAFTLVEMLIVVVVIVTLMTITFRLGALNTSSWNRNTTVTRIQRLENCLSGYYAAFGSYPPVATLNSRNPFLKVDGWGMQSDDGEANENIFGWSVENFRKGKYQSDEQSAWRQVEAACKAQPVACSFPFPDEYNDIVLAWSDHLKEECVTLKDSDSTKKIFSAGFDAGCGANIGRFSAYKDKTDWRDLQLFKFGLMSYLLPRFLLMMNADESFYDSYAQWTSNNERPSNPLNGSRFGSWYEVKQNANKRRNNLAYASVANIPSQAVCARWMPNLAGIVFTPHDSLSSFGIELADKSFDNEISFSTEVYSPGEYNSRDSGSQYILDSCTVLDGWKHEFFYYSPAPYQTYILWSAGANGRTFPPWISREELGAAANACIGAWIEDDIVNMSH